MFGSVVNNLGSIAQNANNFVDFLKKSIFYCFLSDIGQRIMGRPQKVYIFVTVRPMWFIWRILEQHSVIVTVIFKHLTELYSLTELVTVTLP